MINTLKRIWELSEKRHKNLITALVLSFIRSVFGVTQLIAIICTVEVLCGEMEPKSGIFQIAVLISV